MKPCISQATTLRNTFEDDLDVFRTAGWSAVEIWLTKLETFLESHSPEDARALLLANELAPAAAAAQGGLLLSQGDERATHWDHFRRRLTLLRTLGVGTLIVTPDFMRQPTIDDFALAATRLGEAAELAGTFGVKLALEFQKTSPLCACLETALALVDQSRASNAGVCLDVFHFHTGSSKTEDLTYLTIDNLAWVQLSDISGTPRELAGDSDRILPGEGDIPLAPLIDHLYRIGYTGYASLEVLNPHLWQVPSDRVADLGRQALLRVLSPQLSAGGNDNPRGGA
jgi:sugar phosphate isomerase/epimerase